MTTFGNGVVTLALVKGGECVCSLPHIWPVGAIYLVDLILRVVDGVDDTLLLNDHARVILVVLTSSSTLTGFAWNGNCRAVDAIACVDLQSFLVCGDIQLDSGVDTPDREGRGLAVVMIILPAVVKPDASGAAILMRGSGVDSTTDGFGNTEVERGILVDVEVSPIRDECTVRMDDLG